jgi:signal transduction histidine kinase
MRRRLTQITEHDAAARLHVPATGDEIASLALTMNAVLDRLQRALVRQRDCVADAGHELRTPLTALKTELELAARPGRSRQALAAAVATAAGDTERLIRLEQNRAGRADPARPRPREADLSACRALLAFPGLLPFPRGCSMIASGPGNTRPV